ncbi:YciI-like protein [Cyclobacterium sp. 1_MG-2023]|uniref:YciI-like protein n=1 Tax=Cyclobacterium sp. 1_MG-2023 TaxID=3062681 RepID=UPI0026E46300|nr:YciI-like protein [Cyclobacterium sp. 1_MG-2023]MDO6438268.1 YciI-like protein [Cyclobacterium sp. 1_MG-2023]
MKYYMLTYLLSEGYMENRGEFREDHLALADEFYKKGVLLMGGALSRPADKAVLIFRSEGENDARDFIKADPYVTNGLVESWELREWKVVVGVV